VEAKEPWDSSTQKAKELKASDFGTPEEVRKITKMPRQAKERKEVIIILKEIAKKGILKSKAGEMASLSGKSIDKIVSEQALHQSFDRNAHWQAAANIDTLFSHAIEPWKFELNPNKTNENLKDRRYFYALMEYEGKVHPVKITVKQYKQTETEKRIYSIEAIGVDV
jgi:hypothetical protein